MLEEDVRNTLWEDYTLNFFQLECFAAIVRTKSFSEAAHILYISQSSISKHIAKLEEELHLQLFNRTKLPFELTEPGERFYAHVQNLLAEYNSMKATMQRYSDDISIQFGCIENIGRMGLAAPLGHFMSTHPNVQLSVKLDHTWNLMEQLRDGTINLAIINQVISGDGSRTNIDGYNLSSYDYYSLNDDQYYAIINRENPLARRQQLTWSDLKDEPLLMFDESYSLSHFIRQEFQNAAADIKVAFECNVVDNLLGLVSSNTGVAFLPNSISKAGFSVCSVPITPSIRRKQLFFVSKSIAVRKSVMEFVQVILKHYAKEST